tara:strand:+ start:80 stop:943 length:864 start_codon:yes stop_codon:yes gene_type:complete
MNVKWLLGERDPRSYYGGAEAVLRYNKACIARRQIYPIAAQNHKEIIDNLDTKGYHVVKNAIDKSILFDLLSEFEAVRLAASHVPALLKENNQYFTVINQPLIQCPTTLELAFNKKIINIVSEFFKCTPALGTLNLRRSHVNSDGPIKHQLFHVDQNSIKFVKVFFYLNDVKSVDDGPLTFVENSLHNKFEGWSDQTRYRRSEQEIKAIYGNDSIKYMLADVGDMIIARPTAFHRGTSPTKNMRTMLTLNYVIHPEEWKQPTFEIEREAYRSLSDDVKPVADFLVKV